MLVAIWGPNLDKGGVFHIHKPGCQDTLRGQYLRTESPWTLEAETDKDVIEDIYVDIIAENPGATWEDYAEDVKFFPCVSLKKA